MPRLGPIPSRMFAPRTECSPCKLEWRRPEGLGKEPTLTSANQAEATRRIVAELADCGIKLVASLPDDWVCDLIDAIDRDDRFRLVPVNREESAVGLCSGAFFGGLPALALMGASGLMTLIY